MLLSSRKLGSTPRFCPRCWRKVRAWGGARRGRRRVRGTVCGRSGAGSGAQDAAPSSPPGLAHHAPFSLNLFWSVTLPSNSFSPERSEQSVKTEVVRCPVRARLSRSHRASRAPPRPAAVFCRPPPAGPRFCAAHGAGDSLVWAAVRGARGPRWRRNEERNESLFLGQTTKGHEI